jgi:hypothetical protein
MELPGDSTGADYVALAGSSSTDTHFSQTGSTRDPSTSTHSREIQHKPREEGECGSSRRLAIQEREMGTDGGHKDDHPSLGPSSTPLQRRSIFVYGTGHVLNDLTAACWFTYLLIFLTDVGLSPK